MSFQCYVRKYRKRSCQAGWTKELNLISWNDRAPKYDIRDWAPDRAKMGKGVTVSADEVILLRDLLNELDL